MQITTVEHPVLAHKLSLIRSADTDSPTFRRLVDESVTLMAFEATRHLRTQPYPLRTPVAETTGVRLAAPAPIIVPVLRAGLGMLDAMTRMLPIADVGFLGAVRDEQTLEVSTYGARLPADLTGRQCLVLDPMLATGHTLAAAISALHNRGCRDIAVICLLAAPEGLAYLRKVFPGGHQLDAPTLSGLATDTEIPDGTSGEVALRIITASVDLNLNEHGYIVPGLGDAGDRLYGAPE